MGDDLAVRQSTKRGRLTAVACEACRKRKSKCDGARPICSTCRSKDVADCVYEAGVDGSRIQQLRKHNQNLKDKVASLQVQLSESWAENDQAKRQFENYACSPDLSPVSDRPHNASELSSYSKGDLEARFREIRAGDVGRGALSKHRQQAFVTDGKTPTNYVTLPMHFIQPSTHSHDSPVSKVYSSFREYARQAIADGEPVSRVLGTFEVNSGVIYSNSNFENASYLSQWAGQVVSAWGLQSLAPKIGIMYLVFRLMRWQVSSSHQDFLDIPEIMKPTSIQLCVPHPPFIDFLVWPSLRDLFISESETYKPLEWAETIAQTLNLARDFTFNEVLYGEPSTGHFRMRDTFRVYVEDIDHWTLDRKVANLIPEAKGKVQVR